MLDKLAKAAGIDGIDGLDDILSGKNMLKLGAQGQVVEMVQKALSKGGFDPGKIDGKFGPITKKAVEAFQEKMGAKKDGVVGPETGGKLQDLIKDAMKGEGLGKVAGGLLKGLGK